MAVTPGALVGAAAINSATSGGTSSGGSASSSASYSRTYGTQASQRATQAANTANTAANAAWNKAAEYNAAEAQKQRDWLEKMANTTYQRTVKDMIAAGVNPILAANMGLSADSITSGATATMGNPMSYMANTFADSESASQSQGSSWSESMSGLAYLANVIKGIAENMTSGMNITVALDGLKDLLHDPGDTTGDGQINFDDTYSGVLGLVEQVIGKNPGELKNKFMSKDSDKYKNMTKNWKNAQNYKSPGRMNEASWGTK